MFLIDSVKKALRGEEKLWKVFWLWGALLYVSSIVVGIFSTFLDYDYRIIKYLVGILGLVLIFVYPVLLIKSLYRCAQNTEISVKHYLIKYFCIIFIFIHLVSSVFIFGGCIILFGVTR